MLDDVTVLVCPSQIGRTTVLEHPRAPQAFLLVKPPPPSARQNAMTDVQTPNPHREEKNRAQKQHTGAPNAQPLPTDSASCATRDCKVTYQHTARTWLHALRTSQQALAVALATTARRAPERELVPPNQHHTTH